MPAEPATLDDLERIVDLWVALATEQRAHGSHLTAEPNRAVMREALAQHIVDHTCLVARTGAERQASIVGFISFALDEDGLDRDVRRGVVHNLYVDPCARREGIGSQLLAAAEDALAAAGADVITLEALFANTGARRFYDRHGYEPQRVSYERRPD